jgi:hypothetical protein
MYPPADCALRGVLSPPFAHRFEPIHLIDSVPVLSCSESCACLGGQGSGERITGDQCAGQWFSDSSLSSCPPKMKLRSFPAQLIALFYIREPLLFV